MLRLSAVFQKLCPSFQPYLKLTHVFHKYSEIVLKILSYLLRGILHWRQRYNFFERVIWTQNNNTEQQKKICRGNEKKVFRNNDTTNNSQRQNSAMKTESTLFGRAIQKILREGNTEACRENRDSSFFSKEHKKFSDHKINRIFSQSAAEIKFHQFWTKWSEIFWCFEDSRFLLAEKIQHLSIAQFFNVKRMSETS